MMVSFFAAILITTAQLQPSSSFGEPFVFDMTDGTRIHALAQKSDVENERQVQIEVRIEEPWKRFAENRTLRRKDIDFAAPEAPATYNIRVKKEWEAHGGVLIETGSGESWVLQSELDLAQRSIDLSTPEITTEAAPVPVPSVVQRRESVGFVAQWWMHGTLGLGMLVLISGVFWWGFLKKSWSSV
jgi:hypothetical protein